MRERPILMHAESVRAILDGSKTQTRRVVQPQPTETDWVGRLVPGERLAMTLCGRDHSVACPFGQPGDCLWVREAWYHPRSVMTSWDRNGPIEGEGYDRSEATRYRADGEQPPRVVWRPSIHMPRWASRMTLEVTEVRVERVQDITYQDVLAEGFTERPEISSDPEVHRDAGRDWFMERWEALNAKRGHGWQANPWVWAVTFTRSSP